MAKHPHKLMLHQQKTWKCKIPNCRYFIHIGLEHTLPGQTAVCWGCSAHFMIDEESMEEAKRSEENTLYCSECRMRKLGIDMNNINDIIEARQALARAGVKSPDELNQTQRSTLKMMGIDVDKLKDEIEAHAPDCASYEGDMCNCK